MEGTDQEVTERPSRYGHCQRIGCSSISVYTANDTGDEREETSGTKAIYHDERYEWGNARRRGPNSKHAERVDGQREDQSSDWAN